MTHSGATAPLLEGCVGMAKYGQLWDMMRRYGITPRTSHKHPEKIVRCLTCATLRRVRVFRKVNRVNCKKRQKNLFLGPCIYFTTSSTILGAKTQHIVKRCDRMCQNTKYRVIHIIPTVHILRVCLTSCSVVSVMEEQKSLINETFRGTTCS